MLLAARSILAAALFIALLATTAHAAFLPSPTFNLTGTWEGSYTCKGVENGAPIKFKVDQATLTISHISPTALVAHLEAAGANGGSFTYNGFVQENAAKPGTGAATLVECATRSDFGTFDEVISASKITVTPSAKNPAKAKIVATATFDSTTVAGGICKLKFTRTSTDNPDASGCAPTCVNPT